MDRITFSDVLPQVFSGQSDAIVSDVWRSAAAFERGRSYLIEAESGKGKSTFCSYILGYRNDYSGRIVFDDCDARLFTIADWSQLRRCQVSCLFQELRLFPELTAFENVDIKNRLTRNTSRQQIREWFDRLEIADKLDTRVALLSFGQQQRVALMRALVQPFSFLLADEPISHVDDRMALVMSQLIREESARQGAAVIVTSIGKRLPMDYDSTLHL